MIGLFDPTFWILVGPAILLGLLAQIWVKSAYASAQRIAAPLSGAAAARHILDSAGLQQINVEQVSGRLSDHYDPRQKVLRLSREVYQSRSLAAVGIAAHEAGHAIQDARGYLPLAVRSAAVPAASFGSGAGIWMLILGLIFQLPFLLWAGIALFVCFVFFQVVNLPVEFNASSRAKAQLAELRIVDPQGMVYVNRVLQAAALTYLAATLQAVLTLVYYLTIARGRD